MGTTGGKTASAKVANTKAKVAAKKASKGSKSLESKRRDAKKKLEIAKKNAEASKLRAMAPAPMTPMGGMAPTPAAEPFTSTMVAKPPPNSALAAAAAGAPAGGCPACLGCDPLKKSISGAISKLSQVESSLMNSLY